jgi:hypothetical protein
MHFYQLPLEGGRVVTPAMTLTTNGEIMWLGIL